MKKQPKKRGKLVDLKTHNKTLVLVKGAAVPVVIHAEKRGGRMHIRVDGEVEIQNLPVDAGDYHS